MPLYKYTAFGKRVLEGPLTKEATEAQAKKAVETAAKAKQKSAENSAAWMRKAGRVMRANKEADAAWAKGQDRPYEVRRAEERAIYDKHLHPGDRGTYGWVTLGNSPHDAGHEMHKHILRMGRTQPHPYMCPTKQRIIAAVHSGQNQTATQVSGRTSFMSNSADKHPSVHPH